MVTGAAVRLRDVLEPVPRRDAVVGRTAAAGSEAAGRGRATALGSMIVRQAIEELDRGLGETLVRTLELDTDLSEAARRSRERPGEPVFVPVGHLYEVRAGATAELDVVLDRVRRIATVTVSASVVFGLLETGVQVVGGFAVALAGRQTVNAALTVDRIQLADGRTVTQNCTVASTSDATDWYLAPLPRAVPLLDAGRVPRPRPASDPVQRHRRLHGRPRG